MPNGREILGDLDYTQKIERMGDRELLVFVAQQTLGQSKDIGRLCDRVEANTKRSIINRFALIALILVLVALGVIDSGLLPFLP